MSYKFLLFDLDHTLLDFDTAEDIALTHFLEEQGVTEIQTYKDYYIPMNKGLWRELEQGKITKLELVNTRFSRLFAHFGIEKDGAELALLLSAAYCSARTNLRWCKRAFGQSDRS